MGLRSFRDEKYREVKKPPPLLTPRIIADMCSGDECADPIELAWTVHDLRRTVATGLAKLGCPRVAQDRILNHVDSSVSAIYDRHRYDAEARVWLQKWADYLDALTVSNVVPLRAA